MKYIILLMARLNTRSLLGVNLCIYLIVFCYALFISTHSLSNRVNYLFLVQPYINVNLSLNEEWTTILFEITVSHSSIRKGSEEAALQITPAPLAAIYCNTSDKTTYCIPLSTHKSPSSI